MLEKIVPLMAFQRVLELCAGARGGNSGIDALTKDMRIYLHVCVCVYAYVCVCILCIGIFALAAFSATQKSPGYQLGF